MAVVTCSADGSQMLDNASYLQQSVIAPALMARPGEMGFTTDPNAIAARMTEIVQQRQAVAPSCNLGPVDSSTIQSAAQKIAANRTSAQFQANAPYESVDEGGAPVYADPLRRCPPGSIPHNGVNSDGGCRPDMAAASAALYGRTAPGQTPQTMATPVQTPAVTPAAPVNALNRVTPVSSSIAQAQTNNVLSAPTGAAPVTQQQIQNVQNNGINRQTYVGANEPEASSTNDWITDNWQLLAVAAVGLFFITKGK